MTKTMNERFGEQEDYLARELDRLENAISDENHALEICSREEIWKIVYRLIDLAVAEERKRIVEKCQKEMYKSLEEVCQYKINGQQMFVNKNDIKVWIKSLEN